jgi:hypothetical protein
MAPDPGPRIAARLAQALARKYTLRTEPLRAYCVSGYARKLLGLWVDETNSLYGEAVPGEIRRDMTR